MKKNIVLKISAFVLTLAMMIGLLPSVPIVFAQSGETEWIRLGKVGSSDGPTIAYYINSPAPGEGTTTNYRNDGFLSIPEIPDSVALDLLDGVVDASLTGDTYKTGGIDGAYVDSGEGGSGDNELFIDLKSNFFVTDIVFVEGKWGPTTTVTGTVYYDNGAGLVEAFDLVSYGGSHYTPYECGWETDKISIFLPNAAGTGAGAFRYAYVFVYGYEVAASETYAVNYSVESGDGYLAATVEGNAIVSGTKLNPGERAVFTATPADGYRVKEWKDNGTTVNGRGLTYTVEDIDAAHAVTVAFEPIPEPVDGEWIRLAGSGDGPVVTVYHYMETPGAGTLKHSKSDMFFPSLEEMSDDLAMSLIDGTVSPDMEAVGLHNRHIQNAPMEIVIDLKKDFIITNIVLVENCDSGTTPTGSVYFNNGGSFSKAFDLNPLSGDTELMGYNAYECEFTTDKISILMPCDTLRVGHVFVYGCEVVEVIEEFAVDFGVVNGNGSLAATVDSESIDTGANVESGKSVVFTATPDNGYQVKEWKDNNSVVNGTNASYTISDITAAHNVTVEFELIPEPLTSTWIKVANSGSGPNISYFINASTPGTGSVTGNSHNGNFASKSSMSETSVMKLLDGEITTDMAAFNLHGQYTSTSTTADGMAELSVDLKKNYVITDIVFVENRYSAMSPPCELFYVDSNGDYVSAFTLRSTSINSELGGYLAYPCDFETDRFSIMMPANGVRACHLFIYGYEAPEKSQYTLNYSVVNGNGTLRAKVGTTSVANGTNVEEGKSVVLTASPVTGFRVKEWLDNGVAVNENNKTYEIGSMTEAHNITVEFEEATYEPWDAEDVVPVTDAWLDNLDAGVGYGDPMKMFADYEIYSDVVSFDDLLDLDYDPMDGKTSANTAEEAGIWRTAGAYWRNWWDLDQDAPISLRINFMQPYDLKEIWLFDGIECHPAYDPTGAGTTDSEYTGGTITVYAESYIGDHKVKLFDYDLTNSGEWVKIELDDTIEIGRGKTYTWLTYEKRATAEYYWGDDAQGIHGPYPADVNVSRLLLFGLPYGERYDENDDNNDDDDDDPIVNPGGVKPSYTIAELLGTNAHEHSTLPSADIAAAQNHVDNLSALGALREYHNWGWTEYFAGDDGQPLRINDQFYPLSAFSDKVNPNYDQFNPNDELYKWGGFDNFYTNLKAAGVEPDICLQGTASGIGSGVAGNMNWYGTKLSTDPNSYLGYAMSFYQHAARYGSNTEIDPDLVRVAGGTEKKIGMDVVKYYENGNEIDKGWGSCYYSPSQFAAMTSAVYDGHMNSMTAWIHDDTVGELNEFGETILNGVNIGVPTFKPYSGVGLKNADPNAMLVMAGTSGINMPMLRGMTEWFKANRTKAQYCEIHGLDPNISDEDAIAHGWVQFPVDVLNVHHYCPDLSAAIGGCSPEDDALYSHGTGDAPILEGMAQVVALRDQFYPSAEVWNSEFGWDTIIGEACGVRVETNSYSGPGGIVYPAGTFNVGVSNHDIQGRWIVREYLLLASVGVNRAFQFWMYDGTAWSGYKFGTCGMIEGVNGTKKDSWYYVNTMKTWLGNTKFEADITPAGAAGADMKVFKFADADEDSQNKAYALWLTTSKGNDSVNFKTYELALPDGASSAKLITLMGNDADGVVTNLTIEDGSVTINVSEKPVFVVVDFGQATFDVSYSTVGSGIISATLDSSNFDGGVVSEGKDVVFTAIPSNFFEVNVWKLNGNVVQTSGNSYTLSNVSANAVVTVEFMYNGEISGHMLKLTDDPTNIYGSANYITGEFFNRPLGTVDTLATSWYNPGYESRDDGNMVATTLTSNQHAGLIVYAPEVQLTEEDWKLLSAGVYRNESTYFDALSRRTMNLNSHQWGSATVDLQSVHVITDLYIAHGWTNGATNEWTKRPVTISYLDPDTEEWVIHSVSVCVNNRDVLKIPMNIVAQKIKISVDYHSEDGNEVRSKIRQIAVFGVAMDELV